MQTLPASLLLLAAHVLGSSSPNQTIDTFRAHPPIHVITFSQKKPAVLPSGLTPSFLKQIYHLPSSGGNGTIAIVDAFADPHIESDLAVFNKTYNLSSCTIANKCLSVQKLDNPQYDSGWALEESLDVEWAHAVAPNARIMLVEASSDNGIDLVNAVDFARFQQNVRSISMSWGSSEFSDEVFFDDLFTSANGHTISFFASSGDSGNGVSWPAVSSNVIGVGGTSVKTFKNSFISETAWSGSGGGVSEFETEPGYQSYLNIPQSNSMRGVPDVAFDADPNTGVAVYDSNSYGGQSGWFQVGGTSLGAPVWGAMNLLSNHINSTNLYNRAKNSKDYFRDIVMGTNGTCTYFCSSRKGYDYITGIGSPLSDTF